jgi:acetyltransferase-like isoleucine patch superfamily enzyme
MISTMIRAAIRRYAMSVGMFLIPFSTIRIFLLRAGGVTIGRGCYIGFNVICDTNYANLITIGDNVTISHNVTIYAHTKSRVTSPLSSLYQTVTPVKIGDGAWIGSHSLILPGVIVAPHCMIGAGSVVTRSTQPRSLYAGNPCRRIKSLPIDDDQE